MSNRAVADDLPSLKLPIPQFMRVSARETFGLSLTWQATVSNGLVIATQKHRVYVFCTRASTLSG